LEGPCGGRRSSEVPQNEAVLAVDTCQALFDRV
jgi:hypothetical protein